MIGEIAYKAIEDNRAKLVEVEKNIWENPEGPYREFKACQWTADVLKDAGFDVEIGVAGIPTAIKATWGSGHPVIGLLGEYDALPGMSQTHSTHKEPIEGQAYGQGCGHNLLGVAHLGAAIGLKAEMGAKNLPGTVVFYGCPAEEVLTGKPFMARGGAFDCLDMCIAFHPGKANQVLCGSAVGINSVKFHFKGRTAHAGGDPHNGRSALDAVELCNVGAQYLREHVTSDVRIHYIILEGGTAPNIVPDKASTWYMVRALTREAVVDVYERLLKVAKGAAMMTETELEIEYLGGCYPTLNNQVFAKVLYDVMGNTPKEAFTEEEKAFAHEINSATPKQYETQRKAWNLPEGTELHEGLLPNVPFNSYGSYDVGDVQYIVPGIMFNTTCNALGSVNHSWQTTACVGSSIGEKGMIYASKVMAHFCLKVIEDPSILAAAQEEFKQVMGDKKYVCPIPAEVPVP